MRDTARVYLERSMNINMMQQKASVETCNRPRDALAVHAPRRIVDRVEHPLGPNHTSIVSMTVHGRNIIAADDCTRNNQLTSFVPQGMSEN